MTTPQTAETAPASLIEFPTDFKLKIMGAQHPDFVDEILQAIRPHAPETGPEQVSLRASAKGNFIGATVSVYVHNQEQLDNIYRAVTSHPLVKVVF